MKSVKLYGELADTFGETFELDVADAREALRLLEANYPGKFFKKLSEGSFHVFVTDKDESAGSELDLGRDIQAVMPMRIGSNSRIHIMPIAEGAKNGKGFFSIILGVVLIAAAIVFAPAGAGLFGLAMDSAILGGALGSSFTVGAVVAFGAAMILGGIASLLTPVPKIDSSFGSEDQKQSFLFNGAVNTIEQGGPVPVIYGEVFCGSVVISASLIVERLEVETETADDGKGGNFNFTTNIPKKRFWSRVTQNSDGVGGGSTLVASTPVIISSPWASPWQVEYTFNGDAEFMDKIELNYGGITFTEIAGFSQTLTVGCVDFVTALANKITAHPEMTAVVSSTGASNAKITITSTYRYFEGASLIPRIV